MKRIELERAIFFIDLLEDMGIDVDRSKYKRWHFSWGCERFSLRYGMDIKLCYN